MNLETLTTDELIDLQKKAHEEVYRRNVAANSLKQFQAEEQKKAFIASGKLKIIQNEVADLDVMWRSIPTVKTILNVPLKIKAKFLTEKSLVDMLEGMYGEPPAEFKDVDFLEIDISAKVDKQFKFLKLFETFFDDFDCAFEDAILEDNAILECLMNDDTRAKWLAFKERFMNLCKNPDFAKVLEYDMLRQETDDVGVWV